MQIVTQVAVRYLQISPVGFPMMLASAAPPAGHASPTDFVSIVQVPRLLKGHARTKPFQQIHALDYV